MNKKYISILIALVLVLSGITLTRAAPDKAQFTRWIAAPTVISYQGQVKVSGTPFNGNGYFKFAIVNAAGTITYWSNDGSGGEPAAPVPLPVTNGLFTVLLGDTSLNGMTMPLEAEVFSAPDRFLRVWFRSSESGAFTLLSPDTHLASVPYAFQAQHVAPPDNMIIVAKSNGDFTSIANALDSINDADAGNPYLIWVGPGWYDEAITLKPYVHLQGAGQGVTFIQAAPAFDGGLTLALASHTSVRDLNISNVGSVGTNYGVYGDNVLDVELSDITAEVCINGTSAVAIKLTGITTVVTMNNVTATGCKASDTNTGLSITLGPEVTIHGGTFSGSGGANAFGIRLSGGSDTFLGAVDVHAIAADASTNNVGLSNSDYPTVLLQGGFFMGSGGLNATGIENSNGAHLEAEGITAQGESGATNAFARALYNHDDSQAILRGGSFIARAGGGKSAWAIHNEGSTNTLLEAHNLTALGEGGSSYNYGLLNDVPNALIFGDSFVGSGGAEAYGAINIGNLNIQDTYILGVNGSSDSVGLLSIDGITHADGCKIKGGTHAIYQYDGTIYIALSQLDGDWIYEAGTFTCFQIYGASYLPHSCP